MTEQPTPETEPTHEGPDPAHGFLTTHRGTREQCSAPDCGPAPVAEQCTAPAYAFVIVRPDPTDADALDLTAGSHAMNPAAVAYGLRNAADAFDRQAREQGDEPIPYPAATPSTEREHWQAIADALNNANRAGMPVGIDLDGVLTDHNEHAVIWNFEAERWDVAGYDDDTEPTPAIPDHVVNEEQPADEEQPRPHPTVGARYIKRAEPDAGRIVTVTSVWTADDGHTAVAYEWDDDKPGQCGSACPLAVFERTYAPAPCAHQWVTALDGNDRPARDDHGHTWEHCGLCGEVKGKEQRALDLLTEIYEELGHDHRARHLAAALLDQHARGLAERITALGKARGWSTWAADYIHPDREFVDPGTPAEATE